MTAFKKLSDAIEKISNYDEQRAVRNALIEYLEEKLEGYKNGN